MSRPMRTRWSPRSAWVLPALLLTLLGVLLLPPPAQGAVSYKVLYAFPLSQPPLPSPVNPSGLLLGADGAFYGTTYYGGAFDSGSVFKLAFAPTPTLSTLYSFTGITDGVYPYFSAGLLLGSDGNFYGTTKYGGPDDLGTVFQLTPAGSLTTLHSFSGADGQWPQGGILRTPDGTLYGTTSEGGDSGYGTIFKLTPTGTPGVYTSTTLHTFSGTAGAYPTAGLLLGTDGNLYGTTYSGGTGDLGTVFKLTLAGTPTLTMLYAFATGGAGGANPQGTLLRDPDGTLYGTTTAGGTTSLGTVFKLDPTNALTTLHTFAGTDGAAPQAGLLRGSDGAFYGTTSAGSGATAQGTLFQLTLTPTPTLTTLYAFPAGGAEGAAPQTGLTQGSDGYFYGTTALGGSTVGGVLYRLRVGQALTLTAAGTGHGGVTSTPAGISCADPCTEATEVFLPGSTVTLTATAATGSTFTGWSGTDLTCPGTDPCAVPMGVARTVTATFTLQTFALTLQKGGTGTGTVTSTPSGIDCGTTCSHSFAYNTEVTLTATAISPSVFAGWSGEGCSGTSTCKVTLTQARTVTATFEPPLTALTVSVAGSSPGSVTSTAGGSPGCTTSTSCTASFPTGTAVTVTKSPDPGGTFKGWRGACTGTGACVVTLGTAMTVTAVFSKTFTDPLTGGSTPIKAVHFTELRDAINALRSHRTPALPAFTWTDAAPAINGLVRASHLLNLRTALSEIQAQTWGESTITAGTTSIKASHLTELRTKVGLLE